MWSFSYFKIKKVTFVQRVASMAAQVDSAVLHRTKETLGKVIKKPPLTDKLLSRPPFRFLHDIVNEVNIMVAYIHKEREL